MKFYVLSVLLGLILIFGLVLIVNLVHSSLMKQFLIDAWGCIVGILSGYAFVKKSNGICK